MFLDFSGTIFQSLFFLLSIIVVINVDVDVDVFSSLWIRGCTSTGRTTTIEDAAESRGVALASTDEAEDETEDENPGAYSAERGDVEAEAVADQADLVLLGRLVRSSSLGLGSFPLGLLQLNLQCFFFLKYFLRFDETFLFPSQESPGFH